MTAPMTPKLDEARLRELRGRAERSLRSALDSGRSWAFYAPRVPRADLERVLDALSAERAVSQRWHDAYSIAHDQATENGQRLSAERERGDRAVKACEVIMGGKPYADLVPLLTDYQRGHDNCRAWAFSVAANGLATQKAEGA